MKTQIFVIATAVAAMIQFTGCKKEDKTVAAEPAAAAVKPPTAPKAEPAAPPAAAATAGQISMLAHLQAVNKTMCPVLVKLKPGKTLEECVTMLNKMSEMNPSNKTTMVSGEKSAACLKTLAEITGADIMAKSAQGACAVAALN